jgi:hypothetical protein
LEHIELISQGFAKYGMCPLIETELRKAFFINRAILRRNDQQRLKGNRKDLYVTAED